MTTLAPVRHSLAEAASPLIEQVRAAMPDMAFEDLTRDRLRGIARDNGIDWGTALLYDSIRRAEWNREFLERIDSHESPTAMSGGTEVLVAPGALYREQPRFGADGRAVRAAAQDLGMSCRVIDVASMGSVTGNAEIIAQELERESRPVILASLSKGGSDVRIALERHPHIAGKIHCWLNFCGLIRGTPISDSLLGTRWWQRGILRGYLAYTRAHRDFVSELAATADSLLGQPMNADVARTVRIINVVAFPLTAHLSRNSAARHARLAVYGPNDGTALLCDEIVEPGFIYPVWGADHFMQAPSLAEIMRRLLQTGEAA